MCELKLFEADTELANNLVRFCKYWKSQPRARESIRLSQQIGNIRRQAQADVTALASTRKEYNCFLETLSIEEWRAYEEHFENEERFADSSA